MAIDWRIVADIAVPVLALPAGAFLDRWLERRPKLITYYGHVSAHTLRGDGDPITINTHTVIVRNAGRRSATNVRLGHVTLPDFNVFPDVAHTVAHLPGGGREILIPILVPQQEVSVSYMYPPPLLFNEINTHVRSDEGDAQVVFALPTPLPAAWYVRTIWTLVVLGLVAAVYLLVELLRWLL